MSIAQVSGPCYLYISRLTIATNTSGVTALSTPAAAAQLYFLGTCETPPTLQLNPQWEPIMNDIGGSMLPIDYSYQGEDAVLSGTLNKWNELVYKNLASHSLAQGVSGRGSELWKDVGTLAQLEAIAFQLYVHFPYSAAKTIYGTTNSMPVGYRCVACRLAGHSIGPGTRANRRQLVVHSDRALLETFVNTTSGFTLYDHSGFDNIPAVPPIKPTGQVSLG
jgi:hypothetical protein